MNDAEVQALATAKHPGEPCHPMVRHPEDATNAEEIEVGCALHGRVLVTTAHPNYDYPSVDEIRAVAYALGCRVEGDFG